MSRFLALFCAITLLSVSPALAAFDPSLEGDMAKLVVYAEPKSIPRVMLSSSDKGLTYLSDFERKLTIVNLWATWCPPCVEELPSLNALQLAMGSDKFQVVTVSLDTSGLDSVKKYLADHNLKALVGYTDSYRNMQELEVLNGLPGIPLSLILDPQGNVIALMQGSADWNGPAARKVIEYYLANVTFN